MWILDLIEGAIDAIIVALIVFGVALVLSSIGILPDWRVFLFNIPSGIEERILSIVGGIVIIITGFTLLRLGK